MYILLEHDHSKIDDKNDDDHKDQDGNHDHSDDTSGSMTMTVVITRINILVEISMMATTRIMTMIITGDSYVVPFWVAYYTPNMKTGHTQEGTISYYAIL